MNDPPDNTNILTQSLYDFDSIKMSNVKIDISRRDGTNDYRIWKGEIQSFLAQKKFSRVLEDPIKFLKGIAMIKQEDMLETSTSIIIFNLSYAIISLVDK